MDLILYGLQRSGTNFIEKVFTERYRVNFINQNNDRACPAAKHFRLYDNKDIVPEPGYRNNVRIENYTFLEKQLKAVPNFCVVISKDPYSWLLSYEKWAQRCNWAPVCHHYIEEYNLFYAKWLEFAKQTDKIVFIRYIDLLYDIKQELKRLEKLMRLKRKLSAFFAEPRYKLVPQSEEFTQDCLDYYLEQQYFAKYSKERLEEVNGHLDANVMLGLGYTIKQSI